MYFSKVACFGKTVQEAYLKALKSTGFKVPKKAILFGIQESFHPDILESARLFQNFGLEVKLLHKFKLNFN